MKYKPVERCKYCGAELELRNGKCSYCGSSYIKYNDVKSSDMDCRSFLYGCVGIKRFIPHAHYKIII